MLAIPVFAHMKGNRQSPFTIVLRVRGFFHVVVIFA